MALLEILPAATNATPDEARTREQAKSTHAGQAHFAGSAPFVASCRDCRFWSNGAEGEEPRANQKKARCLKYSDLMRGRKGPQVPGYALACKYVDRRTQA